MKLRIALVTLGVIVLAALIAALVFSAREVEVEIELPQSAEARRNPLLALQRLLHRLDQPVESQSGNQLLTRLPSTGDLLLLYRNTAPLNQQRLDQVLDWVDAGGSLVMDLGAHAEQPGGETGSSLLQRLQIVIEQVGANRTDTIEVPFDGEEQPVRVSLQANHRLFDNSPHDVQEIGDELGSLMLQIEWGEGLITLVADLEMLDNQHIGKAEHAYFAYLLLSGPDKVWLLYDPHATSLPALLWRYAWRLILLLASLGLLWLWSGNRRLGPLAPRSESGQRDLFEHLDAQGGFDWRNHLSAPRMRSAQRAVEQAWLQHQPVLSRLNGSERADWIASHCGLQAEQVRRALYQRAEDQPDFIRLTRLLQQLWLRA